MSIKPDRKELKNQYKMQQKEAFEASLPMPKENFEELFDYLDQRLEEQCCNDDLSMTLDYLEEAGIEPEPVVAWLQEQGGCCDCEVLANMEEFF